MPAWLIPTLASLGSTAIGAAMGGGRDPYNEYLKRARAILNPGAILGDTSQFYNAFLGSPAFAQAQGDIIRASNNLMNRTVMGLANRGLFNTGIGAVLPGLAASAGAGQLGQLR